MALIKKCPNKRVFGDEKRNLDGHAWEPPEVLNWFQMLPHGSLWNNIGVLMSNFLAFCFKISEELLFIHDEFEAPVVYNIWIYVYK